MNLITHVHLVPTLRTSGNIEKSVDYSKVHHPNYMVPCIADLY